MVVIPAATELGQEKARLYGQLKQVESVKLAKG
jgi:hypothetical protein